MKKAKSLTPVFHPCGLSIPEDQIFASPRNLGIAIMAALTGSPTEEVRFNQSEISIGLGCFGLVSMSGPDEDEYIEEIDDDDAFINAAIRYELHGGRWFERKSENADFPLLSFNVYPSGLLRKGENCAIQFFGPERLLRKLSGDWCQFEVCSTKGSMLDVSNYLEGGLEPNDALLTPPGEEYKLFWDAKDPGEKFRILLNIITTFASTLSAKLMYYGNVDLSHVCMPSQNTRRELSWFKDGKLAPAWRPSKRVVEQIVKTGQLKKGDILPSIRRLYWPKKPK